MRYDREHKERTRRRLLQQAAAAIRTDGPDRVSVAALMARLRMTHGGFYAHFASKDVLVAEAIREMFDQRFAYFQQLTAGVSPGAGLAAFIDAYLSSGHCAHPERGCPVPALAGELPRLSPRARREFGAGTDRLVDAMAEQLGELGHDEADAFALATSALAEMAGAIAVARAMHDRKRSETVLRHSRALLKARLALESAETF